MNTKNGDGMAGGALYLPKGNSSHMHIASKVSMPNSPTSETSETMVNSILTIGMDEDAVMASETCSPHADVTIDTDSPTATREPCPPESLSSPPTSIYEQCRSRLLPIVMMSARMKDPSKHIDCDKHLATLITDEHCKKFMQQSKEIRQQMQALEARKASEANDTGTKRDREDELTWSRNGRRRVDERVDSVVASEVSRKDSEATLVESSTQPPTPQPKMHDSEMEDMTSVTQTAPQHVENSASNAGGPDATMDIDVFSTTHDRSMLPEPSLRDSIGASAVDAVVSSPIQNSDGLLDSPHANLRQQAELPPSAPSVPPEKARDVNMLSEEVNSTDGASHSSLPSSSSAIPTSHMHPYHPLIALSNPSTQTTQLPAWGAPGLWCMKAGLESTGLLDIDFEVTPDLLTLNEPKNDEANQSPLQFTLHLLCLPRQSISELSRHVDHTTSNEVMVNKVEQAPMGWPAGGKLAIHMNPGRTEGRSWLPRDLDETKPLDVTIYTSIGKNTLRIIQFGDLSEYTFMLHAFLASPDPGPESTRMFRSRHQWQSLRSRLRTNHSQPSSA